MHVLVTRPASDAGTFATRLEALGHTVTVDPLLRIELLPISPEQLAGATCLVATSRNGLRALAASSAAGQAVKLPLVAVGPGTAALAKELGFTDVSTGPGTGADLVPLLTKRARNRDETIAHIRGEKIAFDLRRALAAHGVEAREIVTYRSVAAEGLSPATRLLLEAGKIDAAILMSPRTGAIFARLVDAERLEKAAARLVLLCLSPAVAAAIEPLRAARVEVAETPDAEGMLAAVTRVATLWSGV